MIAVKNLLLAINPFIWLLTLILLMTIVNVSLLTLGMLLTKPVNLIRLDVLNGQLILTECTAKNVSQKMNVLVIYTMYLKKAAKNVFVNNITPMILTKTSNVISIEVNVLMILLMYGKKKHVFLMPFVKPNLLTN